MKELIPLHDYVVLEEVKPEEGALILSQESEDAQNIGRVISAGGGLIWNGSTTTAADPLVGHEVIFQPHMFMTIDIGGKKQLMGKREFVIAILK